MVIPARFKSVVLLALIVALAIFLRFYRLNDFPPGLWVDVALNGNDALSSLQTGEFKLFYPPENYGREGLMIWLDALSMACFGISALSLKIPAGVFGSLTVLGVYLLARRLFGTRNEMIS